MLTAGLMAGLTLGAAVPALAQESGQQIDLTNAPVDMHEGTCGEFVLDPWDEIGRLNLREFDAYDPYDPDVGYDIFDDDAFLTEDVDDDGVLDDDEDIDDDGVLDIGVDADDDNVLDEDEVLEEGDAAVAIVNLPEVYEAHGEIEDTGLDPIFNQPNIIAVHASSESYENVVACGDLTNVVVDEDDEEVVVGLTPVDGSGVRGYAVFWNDGSLIGTDPTEVDVFVFENLPAGQEGAAEMAESTPTP